EAQAPRQAVVEADDPAEAARRLDPRQLPAQAKARLTQRGEAVDRGESQTRMVPIASRAGAHVIVERDLEEARRDRVAQVEPHHPRVVGEQSDELGCEAHAAVEEAARRRGARVMDAEAHQRAVEEDLLPAAAEEA